MKAAGKEEVETRVAWARMTNVLCIRDIGKYELYKRDYTCKGIVNRNRIRAGPVLNMGSFSRRREPSFFRVDNSSTKSVSRTSAMAVVGKPARDAYHLPQRMVDDFTQTNTLATGVSHHLVRPEAFFYA
jgi:hypothetical protein